MIRVPPRTTELLGISLKNMNPIMPTNTKEVYSKGDVTATSAFFAA